MTGRDGRLPASMDTGIRMKTSTSAKAWRLRELVAADLAASTGRSGCRGLLSAFVFEPGFATMLAHRCAQHLYRNGWPRLGKLLWRWNTSRSGCHIHLDAQIGPGLLLPHPVSVCVGCGVRVGSGVTLYQGVTLGQRYDGHYPTVEDGATLYPNAVVTGPVRIGRASIVGAGAIVLFDVPADGVAVSTPARLLSPRETGASTAQQGPDIT